MAGSVVNLDIRNLAVGGAGVGNVTEVLTPSAVPVDESLLGITAFVPYTIPGEQVHAYVETRKKRYLEGRLSEILKPSPGRVSPRCSHFTTCGGCELQHMSYATQLQAKQEMLLSMLQVAGLEPTIKGLVEPIVPSAPFGYRRRVTLHINQSGQFGFYRPRSREVVQLEECPVVVPQIAALIPRMVPLAKICAGKISSLILEADDLGVVAVMQGVTRLSVGDVECLLEAARMVFDGAKLVDELGLRGEFGRLELQMPALDRAVNVPVGAFSQVNSVINQQLVEAVVDLLTSYRVENIWDLYAGAGNFSIPLFHRGFNVLAVEVDERLVNLGKQVVDNYHCSSVERFLRSSAARKIPQAIIADPPRSGLAGVVEELPSVKTLVLISCHLPSFVRDLKGLIDRQWRVSKILPFDMFPQTSYLEVLTVFER